MVEPADLGLGAEDQVLEDERPGQVRPGARRRSALEPGQVLQVPHGRPALHLDHGRHIDAGGQAYWVCPLVEESENNDRAAAEMRGEPLPDHPEAEGAMGQADVTQDRATADALRDVEVAP